jgi:hypothetical protein
VKEYLVIFESDIDIPRWFAFRAFSESKAVTIASAMLRRAVGRCHWYAVSKVVSR